MSTATLLPSGYENNLPLQAEVVDKLCSSLVWTHASRIPIPYDLRAETLRKDPYRVGMYRYNSKSVN